MNPPLETEFISFWFVSLLTLGESDFTFKKSGLPVAAPIFLKWSVDGSSSQCLGINYSQKTYECANFHTALIFFFPGPENGHEDEA